MNAYKDKLMGTLINTSLISVDTQSSSQKGSNRSISNVM